MPSDYYQKVQRSAPFMPDLCASADRFTTPDSWIEISSQPSSSSLSSAAAEPHNTQLPTQVRHNNRRARRRRGLPTAASADQL